MPVGFCDHTEDLFGAAPRGVDATHRERGVSVGHLVRDGFDQCVPLRRWLVPGGQPTAAFVVTADEVVRDGSREPVRQRDAEPSPHGLVGGEAPGEVALDDHGDAGVEVALDFLGRGEQRGEVEAHSRVDVGPLVHGRPEGLVQGGHGGDEDGLAGGSEHRGDGRLAGAP